MPKQWTLGKIRAMSTHDRATLYKRAGERAHTPEGAALKQLIEEAGLPYSDIKALTNDDPVTIAMWQVINSDEGKRLAVEATEQGLPALAHIDPLLQAKLGVDYGSHNMATNRAGILVGDLMISLGYRLIGTKPMPTGSVAKTAAVWSKAKPLK